MLGRRGYGNSQRVYEPREKLERSRDRRQFNDLEIVIHALDLGVKGIVDFVRRAVQAIAITKTDFFGFGERAFFEIVDGGELRVAGPFLFCGQRVGFDSVFEIVQQTDANRDSFFVPAGERAVSDDGFEKGHDPLGKGGDISGGLDHVGNDAPLLEQDVVDGGDFGRDLIPFEHRDAGLWRLHQKANLAESCIRRGVPLVLVIVPKPRPLKMLLGLAKIG